MNAGKKIISTISLTLVCIALLAAVPFQGNAGRVMASSTSGNTIDRSSPNVITDDDRADADAQLKAHVDSILKRTHPDEYTLKKLNDTLYSAIYYIANTEMSVGELSVSYTHLDVYKRQYHIYIYRNIRVRSFKPMKSIGQIVRGNSNAGHNADRGASVQLFYFGLYCLAGIQEGKNFLQKEVSGFRKSDCLGETVKKKCPRFRFQFLNGMRYRGLRNIQ